MACIGAVLLGNAMPGKHVADAHHGFEAAKHTRFFITHDRRINKTKRRELEACLPSSPWIVTLAEFLDIYSTFDPVGGEEGVD